jgi:phosphoserine aminotransferase
METPKLTGKDLLKNYRDNKEKEIEKETRDFLNIPEDYNCI